MIRTLKKAEFFLYRDHLLRLSFDDRQSRFQCFVSDESITNYVNTIIEQDNHIVLGKFENDDMIGAAHIAIHNNLAEFSFSIDTDYRGKGLSKVLFRACLDTAIENQCNSIYTNCFSQNRPMICLAKSFGLSVVREGRDAYSEGSLSELFKS